MQYLDALYERYGRLKVGFWITFGLFAVVVCCGLYILSELVLTPVIAELPYSASSDQVMDTVFPWIAWFSIGAIVLAGALIRFGLVRPVLLRRQQLEADLANAPPREQIETLSEQKARLGEQLDAVLDDNVALRDKVGAAQRNAAVSLDIQRAVVANSLEALLLTDADAQVRQVSSPMAALLKVRAKDVATYRVGELVQVFDASKDKPFEYPLKRVVEDAIAQASSIPKLHDVVLVDQSGVEHRVMLSVQAIPDRENAVCGALVRIDGDAVHSGAMSEGQASSNAGRAAGLPGREAFDKRADELISIARSQSAEHTLALISVDNVAGVYEEHGYWAVEELFWQLTQLVQDEFGGAVELFHSSLMHFAVLQAFESPEIFQVRAERLRKAVEAFEFRWNKKSYRATITIALSSIDTHCESLTELVGDCDREMRQARTLGGNRVSLQLADEVAGMARSIDERLVKWLAMDEQETRLQMQSFELLQGAEAKPWIGAQLRVEMEDGFWADPGAFLTSAARVGLLPKIDLWLIERVLNAMQSHADLAATHGPVLVPLHMQSLSDAGFVEKLEDLVASSSVDRGRLLFALDDLECASHASTAIEFAQAAQAMGFGIGLTGARVASVGTQISALKPRVVAIHPSVYQDENSARVQAALNYMHGIGEVEEFKSAVVDPVDESTHKVLSGYGVDLVARATLGVGPLY